jgi:hypothetical protein
MPRCAALAHEGSLCQETWGASLPAIQWVGVRVDSLNYAYGSVGAGMGLRTKFLKTRWVLFQKRLDGERGFSLQYNSIILE